MAPGLPGTNILEKKVFKTQMEVSPRCGPSDFQFTVRSKFLPFIEPFSALSHIKKEKRSSPEIRMVPKRLPCISLLFLLTLLALAPVHCRAQAALLMEEPFGLYGILNPTGHNAVYLKNVCADTPLKLRHCHADELGVVISRYDGVDGYDWVAIPLVPYLYSVENVADVPAHVDHDTVVALRNQYRQQHFEPIGLDQSNTDLVHNGWTQLIGGSYERRIFAFRFDTTEEQDNALIAQLNDDRNRSHFHMLFSNCADFARVVLNIYFPHTFRRSIFPDAGVTTPKQLAYKLERYAKKHPEIHLTVLNIPQIPGYRAHSHSTKDIAESFSTTEYAIPLTLLNPYLAGGIFVDYFVRGRYHLVPKHSTVVDPDNLTALTGPVAPTENSVGAGMQATGAASNRAVTAAMGADSGLKESKAAHE
jgi:hypothetical protein